MFLFLLLLFLFHNIFGVYLVRSKYTGDELRFATNRLLLPKGVASAFAAREEILFILLHNDLQNEYL